MMPFMIHFQHLKIQLQAIKTATNDFADHNCIGRGGFGKVYKGELILAKGKAVVAVKRLDRAYGQGNPEFWKEIIMLSRYQHPNIVSLLGFCDESEEKILVYEYASRRSLDLYLKSEDLTWIRRLNICIGAARGLAYLHNPGTTQQRVLHRDIKSSNILLDEDWNAKISDLGLSKFGPANQQYTFLVSNAVGTIGYCDPLYVETGVLTKESDVYSFGVVLFEVLCGRLSLDNNNDKLQSLTGLARRCYKQNEIDDIVFGNLKDEINPKSLNTYAAIAYECLKRDIEDRPLMSKVVKMLQSALEYQLENGDMDEQEETEASITDKRLKYWPQWGLNPGHPLCGAGALPTWHNPYGVKLFYIDEGAAFNGESATSLDSPGDIPVHNDATNNFSSENLGETNQGVPWTEDEHRWYLLGLQKLGKGDWHAISSKYVISRTPTQVASLLENDPFCNGQIR